MGTGGTRTRTDTRFGFGSAHGLGCCCCDAMATAPWEASEELNEFSAQLEWSRRGQSWSTGRGSVLPRFMETRSQVCPPAPQLAVPWRLETFLTHLYDAAATLEKHQHPVCPLWSKPTERSVLLLVILHLRWWCPPGRSGPVHTGPRWQKEPLPGCSRWCWSPRRLSLWPCRRRSGRSWRSWSWSSLKVSVFSQEGRFKQCYCKCTRDSCGTTALYLGSALHAWKHASIIEDGQILELNFYCSFLLPTAACSADKD